MAPGAVDDDATDVVDAVALVTAFARTLRASGVAATTGRLQAFAEALGVLDVRRREDVYWAGRTTLCGQADDLPRYDRAFAAFFQGEVPRLTGRRRQDRRSLSLVTASVGEEPAAGAQGEPGPPVAASASRTEVLRSKDFATLAPQERREVDALIARMRATTDLRSSRRHRPSHRGEVDARRTVQDLLRAGGEPRALRRRDRRQRPRRLVVVVDVSGSMSAYAASLLRFAHAARRRGAPTEVFTVGTRLTRVTGPLAARDPDEAMRAVSAAVPDWSGGTRLGEVLKQLLDEWGQRGLVRGAVVVILSDGWERGDARLLGAQMARLSRLAHRVVWANPRKARPGYAPLAAGMAAALPHVDDFVSGHSLAALEELSGIISGERVSAARRRPTHA